MLKMIKNKNKNKMINVFELLKSSEFSSSLTIVEVGIRKLGNIAQSVLSKHLTHYKPLGFLMFSGGIDKQHRAIMNQI